MADDAPSFLRVSILHFGGVWEGEMTEEEYKRLEHDVEFHSDKPKATCRFTAIEQGEQDPSVIMLRVSTVVAVSHKPEPRRPGAPVAGGRREAFRAR